MTCRERWGAFLDNGEEVVVNHSSTKLRDIAIRTHLKIAKMECLRKLGTKNFERIVREVFIVSLLDQWTKENRRPLIAMDNILDFSILRKKRLLEAAVKEFRTKIFNEISGDLNSMINLNPKHEAEQSLSSTMMIYDICQDVKFVKERAGDVKIYYSAKRRSQGIHYTPWDLATNMAERFLHSAPDKMKILDPAIGSGTFLMACKSVLKEKEMELFGGDVDPIAVFSTRLQLYLIDPANESISNNIVQKDFLDRKSERFWQKKGINAIIMNPPYVSTNLDSAKKYTNLKFKTVKARNLYVFFLERSINLLNEHSVIVAITPINIANGGKPFNTIRQILVDASSKIAMKHIDTVPGYLFNQGKFESGDGSSSVSTRVTIFDIVIGKDEPEIHSTRFIRWKNKSREGMMRIKPERILKAESKVFTEECFPMGGKNDVKLLSKIMDKKTKVNDVISKNGKYSLQILKPIRYYVAVGIDIHDRKNTITLHFDSIEERNAAFSIFVSNTFFWWWRCFGNGQQLRSNEIENFPWIEHQGSIDRLADLGSKLIAMSDDDHIRVTTTNKGTYSSLAYRHGMDVISECDKIITNALFGVQDDYSDFLASTRYPEYKYYDKPKLNMDGLMKHTTPSDEREKVLQMVKSKLESISTEPEEKDRYMSMQQMYELIFENHENHDTDFRLSLIQLAKHKQRSGPVENHFKHDLKNSLSNSKSKGEVINPRRDQWGWPQPVNYFGEIGDRVCWDRFRKNAEKHKEGDSKFKVVSTAIAEIKICKIGNEKTKYSINQKLIDNKVQHLLNCGGVMDASAFHSWTTPRDAIIKFHPNLQYTQKDNSRVRYVRLSV